MTFLGWLSDPFKGLSDLQLGDEKGTLNHLVDVFPPKFIYEKSPKLAPMLAVNRNCWDTQFLPIT